jgi:hypothetical protein
MKSLHDAWELYRAQLPAGGLDARARHEIELAFFAGAEFAVDALQDLNAAGLTLPFAVSTELQHWSSEAHAARYSRKGS